MPCATEAAGVKPSAAERSLLAGASGSFAGARYPGRTGASRQNTLRGSQILGISSERRRDAAVRRSGRMSACKLIECRGDAPSVDWTPSSAGRHEERRIGEAQHPPGARSGTRVLRQRLAGSGACFDGRGPGRVAIVGAGRRGIAHSTLGPFAGQLDGRLLMKLGRLTTSPTASLWLRLLLRSAWRRRCGLRRKVGAAEPFRSDGRRRGVGRSIAVLESHRHPGHAARLENMAAALQNARPPVRVAVALEPASRRCSWRRSAATSRLRRRRAGVLPAAAADASRSAAAVRSTSCRPMPLPAANSRASSVKSEVVTNWPRTIAVLRHHPTQLAHFLDADLPAHPLLALDDLRPARRRRRG